MQCIAALDFPTYDTSALAKEAETKLDGVIKQVSRQDLHESESSVLDELQC